MTAAPNGSDLQTTAGKLADLRARLAEAQAPMGDDALSMVHETGKLSARERIEFLVDDGSFVEIDALARHRSKNFGSDAQRPVTDGVVTGYGSIDGRKVCVFSHDATIFDGSLGEVFGEKIVKIMELALKTGCPLIGINESSGTRIHEGVVTLGMYAKLFKLHTRASGVIPQISVVLGDCLGGHVFSPALTDFTVMVDSQSSMSVVRPDTIRSESSTSADDLSDEAIGGAGTQMSQAGGSHFTAENDRDALNFVKDLCAYLPANNRAEAPRTSVTPMEGSIADNVTARDFELDSYLPDSSAEAYDVRGIIEHVTDGGEFFELQAQYAENIVIGFGRIEGRAVGFVANQPIVQAGCLDSKASEKAARFVRTCDAFNIPLVDVVDVPGFLPGVDEEHNGLIRRGAKLLFAWAEATVGKVSVVTRKAVGEAYCVMGSKELGTDVTLAWPTAQIAVADSTIAAQQLYREELAAAEEAGKDTQALLAEYEKQYEDEYFTPYIAAERGYIDAVIPPNETRGQLVEALRLLDRKLEQVPPKKHGNIPL